MTDSQSSSGSILDKIRAAKAAGSSSAPVQASDSPPPAATPVATPAPVAPPTASATAPKSPADIMAAIRANKAAGASPAASASAAAATPAAAKPAAPAGSAAGKSPADIMAAIRSNKAVGAAAPAAPSAAAAPKAAPAAKPVGLSPAEMIKAARTAESGVPAAPKVVLPSKPLPGKAAPAAAPKAAAAPAIQRRSAIAAITATLLSPIVIAWTSFAATVTASTLALARFMMPNVLVEPPTRFKIGPPSDYSPGTVSTKWQAQFNIWVVNNEVDGVRCIYALSTVCTHLGCTPNWLEGEQKFKCPCHGSGFYKTGINFEGPAPRPLERVGLRLAEDGMLEVDKSVKFQRELGQWTNSSSFVGVG
ncbi:MAG: ubiquinol-cytochrome c reductase iron-sulfur subunit [Planctomycetaceae bacterium]